jgi:hypothetical protein
MLRNTRPLLGSTQKLAVGSRAPRAQLSNLSAPCSQKPLLLPRRAIFRNPVVPLLLRTEFSTKPPLQPNPGDKRFEKEVSRKKLEAHPEQVSAQSTVRHVFEGGQARKTDEEVLGGLKGDLVGPCQLCQQRRYRRSQLTIFAEHH